MTPSDPSRAAPAPRARRLRRSLALAALLLAGTAPQALAQANVEGQWGALTAWPMVPIHAAVLPDGKVMTSGSTPGNAQGGFDFDVWDPAKGLGSDAHVTKPNILQVDSFCASEVLQPWNGEIMIAGGSTVDGNTTYRSARFTWKTSTLGASEQLKYPRWYSTMSTLPDGRLLIHGGVVPYADWNSASLTPEIYTPGQGWRELAGATTARDPNVLWERRYWYPRSWPVAGNKLFVLTGKTMYDIGYDGNGSVGNYRAFDKPNWGSTGSAVMYAPKKVLQVGGGAGGNDDAAPAGSKGATTIDLAASPYRVADTGAMRYGRHWPTATVLPTGEVLVTGGSEGNNGYNYRPETAAYAAEIWNPRTGGWRTGASMQRPRLYHSTALLLPDGRVLSGGGGIPGPYTGRDVEIYSPPYLFGADGKAAARPAIASEPGIVRLGQSFEIKVQSARPVARFTVVKTGAVTHGNNMDQRFLEMPFTGSNGTYRLTMTGDAVDATPGYYMLFAFDDAGVPSHAKMLRVPSPIADDGHVPPAIGPSVGTTTPVADNGGSTGGSGTGGTGTGAGGGTGTGSGTGTGTGTGGTQVAGLPPAAPAPLVAGHSKLCLSVKGGSNADGADLVQETCRTGAAIQTWTWKAANGGYSLVNGQSGKCVDVYAASTADGARLVQWPCHGGDNQVWTARQTAAGTAIVSKSTGKCVDVSAISTASGAQVWQWTCLNSANQGWSAGGATTPTTPTPTTPATPVPSASVLGNAGSVLKAAASPNWMQIGVVARSLSVAADGTAVVVNADNGSVWSYRGDNAWAQLPGALKEVAVGGAGRVYGIGTDDAVYRFNGTAWVKVGNTARTISVAADGTVVVTTASDDIWLKTTDDYAATWRQVPGKSRKVAAMKAGSLWSIGLDRNVYRIDAAGTGAQVGSNVSDIAAAADGTVVVVNSDVRTIWRKTGDDTRTNWAQQPGEALRVAAPGVAATLRIGPDGGVYRLMPQGAATN